MKIRTDVAEMLRLGLTDTQIAARAHVGHKTAAAARAELGLPKCVAGQKPQVSLEQALRDRSRIVDGGHWEWTGEYIGTCCPAFRFNRRRYTAYRAAFIVRHNRQPIGQVSVGCDYPGCVAPDHMDDQPMRNQLRTLTKSIFGGLS